MSTMMPPAPEHNPPDARTFTVEQCGRTDIHERHLRVFTPWRELWCPGLDGTEVDG